MEDRRYHKLFRAIVILGAAITAPACGGDDSTCHHCTPADAPPTDTVAQTDAGVDAPVDAVLIL